MKNTVLVIGAILIVTNLLFGILLSCYSSFNMWCDTVLIAISTALIYLLQTINLKDAFKVSLTILFSISGFIKLALGIFAPSHIEDNWCVIVCVFITMLETLMLLMVNKTSKRI